MALALAATITWQDNSDNENGFILERQLNGGEFLQLTTLFTDAREYTDTTLVGSTQTDNVYGYRVKAFNEDAESDYSNVGFITIAKLPVPAPPPIPEMPANLAGTAMSSSEIRVTWSDQSSNEMGFQLERVANGQIKLITIVKDQVTYLDTGLRKNTWHDYRIRALGSGGPSTWTNKVRVRTLR